MTFDKQVVLGLGIAYAASPFSRVNANAVAFPPVDVAAETGDEKSPLDAIAPRKLADKAGKADPSNGAGHADTSKSKAHKDKDPTTAFFVASASCAGDCISADYTPGSNFLTNAIQQCDSKSLHQLWGFLRHGSFTTVKSVGASVGSTDGWCLGVLPQGDGSDGAEAMMCNSGAKLGLVHCGDAASLWYPTADQLVSGLCWSLGFTSLLTAEGCNELSLSMTTATDGATASITRDETFMLVDKDFIESFPPAPATAPPAPTFGETDKETEESATSCPWEQYFTTRAELKGAVDTYVSLGCNAGADVCEDLPISKYGWPMNSWCVGQVKDMSELFHEMSTFNEVISSWDVSQVTDMSGMFKSANSFNQDLSPWVVSQVQNMSRMFYDATSFNKDFYSWGRWDVSKVQDMSYMFYGAYSFNQDLSWWDTSQVQNMSGMFYDASSFNSNILLWDVSQVKDMSYMFYGASSFNRDLSLWDIRQVQDMREMFRYANSFNQDLCAWADKNFPYNNAQYIFTNSVCRHQSDPQQERGGPFCASNCCSYEQYFTTRDELKNAVDEYVSSGCNEGADVCEDLPISKYGWPMNSWCVDKVTDMSELFYEMSTFNEAISSWDVSQVTDMSRMFKGASAFNQDLSPWVVSQVQNMSGMFWGASSFNQDFYSWGTWDVSKVQDMSYMFYGASSFRGKGDDLSSWDIRQVRDMQGMFFGASSFSQGLCAWADKNFPYNHAEYIFADSGCTFQRDPQQERGGPFCASDCCPYKNFATRDELKAAVDTYVYNGCNEDANACPNITSNYGWPMNSWCVGQVKDMSELFYITSFWENPFNDDISLWDVSQVEDMSGMFTLAQSFNQDLSLWDVSKVQDMSNMFNRASSFNQDLFLWDVSQVKNMNGMFVEATSFNQDLSLWDVSQVKYMNGMFEGASSFNQQVSSWDISQVEDMSYMFWYASSFNQYLCTWANNFPYNNAEDIFTGSGCEYKSTPQIDQGGPFCASDCKDKEN